MEFIISLVISLVVWVIVLLVNFYFFVNRIEKRQKLFIEKCSILDEARRFEKEAEEGNLSAERGAYWEPIVATLKVRADKLRKGFSELS